MVRFLLVEADTSYNVLIGQRTLNALRAIVSTPHSKGTSSSAATPLNIEISEANIKEECNKVETTFMQSEILQCFNIETEHEEESEDEIQMDLDPRAEFEENRPTFDELVVLVQLGQQSNQCTKVGRITNRLLKNDIEHVIVTNADLFAWSPADVPRIDPDFMCHKLAILP